MAIRLDPPKLPDWLERFHARTDLADQGSDLVADLQRRTTTPLHYLGEPPFQTARITKWADHVREAFADDAEFARALDSVGAAEHKASTARSTDEPIGEIANALKDAAAMLRAGIGKELRARGADDIALAIVSSLYRRPHSAVLHFMDGTGFGIDTDSLVRILDDFTSDGVLTPAGGRTVVRLTSRGRTWFEEQVAGEGQKGSKEDAAAWSDARADVLEAASRLGFMASPELRDVAVSLLREIEITVRAGASLATMILCGSFVETMLLDLAEQIPNKLSFTAKPNWSEKVSLKEILDELHDIGLVGDTQRAVSVADHRDLVHPNRRRRQTGIRIDPKSARAMALLVNIVAHDLEEAADKGKLTALKES